MAAFIRETYGVFDALVDSAGVLLDSQDSIFKTFPGVFEVPLEIMRRSFETNTLGPLQAARGLAPLLRDGGRIADVSNGMGQLAEMNGGWPGYGMSKTALNAVTRMLVEELASRKIKVNSVCRAGAHRHGRPNVERTVAEGAATRRRT